MRASFTGDAIINPQLNSFFKNSESFKDFWGKNLSKKDIRTWAKKVAKRDYPAMRKLLGVPKGKTMPGMPELGDGLS